MKILIGTDSLSEGLNLQTCGKLINYDMPWNFMRVEQRIGRVDRIGGRPVVDVSNYFYSGTVEEQIYQGIGEDFEWFQDVVGPAQPVLSQIESAIEDVALEAPSTTRQQTLKDRVARIRAQMDEARAQAITLGELESSPRPDDGREPAIDLPGLERILTSESAAASRFRVHPDIEGAYLLDLDRVSVAVTFNRKTYDAYPNSVKLLTYGEPTLDQLLRALGIESPELDADGGFVGPRGPVLVLSDLESQVYGRG